MHIPNKALRSFTGERWWKSSKKMERIIWNSRLNNYIEWVDTTIIKKKKIANVIQEKRLYEIWDIIIQRIFRLDWRWYKKYKDIIPRDANIYMIIIVITNIRSNKADKWKNIYIWEDKHWNSFNFTISKYWDNPEKISNIDITNLEIKDVIEKYEDLIKLELPYKYINI